MKKLKTLVIALTTFALAGSAWGQLYVPDWGSDRILASHDTGGSNDATTTGNVIGANWTLSWSELPASDGSGNFWAIENGGTSINGEDWGGEVSWISSSIDVTGWNSVSLSITGEVEVNSASPTEFLELYYSLDGGSPTLIQSFSDTDAVAPDNDPVSITIASLDVSSISNMTVSFAADFNGSSDFVRIDDFSVSGVSAIPEPSTYAAIGGLLALGLVMYRRRKQKLAA